MISRPASAATPAKPGKTVPNITFKDIRYLNRTLSELAGPKDNP